MVSFGNVKLLAFLEGKFWLVLPLAGEERYVFIVSVLLCEDDTGLCFGGRGRVTRAVWSCLNDVHHAGLVRISADIERVCSRQNASHRFYTQVKLYLSHSRELRLRTIRDHVAHMIFRLAPALRSAKLRFTSRVRERLLARRGDKRLDILFVFFEVVEAEGEDFENYFEEDFRPALLFILFVHTVRDKIVITFFACRRSRYLVGSGLQRVESTPPFGGPGVDTNNQRQISHRRK